MPILWRLSENTMRYSELKKSLPHITHKMLSSQLRQLENHELIAREVFPVVPPKVEYTITKKGKEVIPVIEVTRNYGLKVMKEKGLKEGETKKKATAAAKAKKRA